MTGIELITPEPYFSHLFIFVGILATGFGFMISTLGFSGSDDRVTVGFGTVMATVGIVLLAFGIPRTVLDSNEFRDAKAAALERLEEHYDVTLDSYDEVDVTDLDPQPVTVTDDSGQIKSLTVVFTGERATLYDPLNATAEYGATPDEAVVGTAEVRKP